VVVACAAEFLIGVDGLAVAIALPTLQGDLGARPIEAQWVLTAYGLSFGGGLLLGGRLGDLYGRRRLLIVGMAVFAAAALAAGTAPTLGVLVAARALQGLGAAAAVPAALALIGSLFPPGRERTRALALMASMAGVGIISGLVLGGLATDFLGWRSVFLLMAPLALLAALVAPRALPEARADDAPGRPDLIGALLVTGGFATLLVGLTRVEHGGLAALNTIVPLVCGLALIAAFVAWERRAPAPLVRLEILRIRSLRSATVGIAANSVAFTAIVYVGTLYLQSALGYNPVEAGLAILPLDVVALAVPLIAASTIARHSPRKLLAISFVVSTLALLWLARAPVPASYPLDILLPLAALGASVSLAFVVLTQEAVAEVDADEKGVASGIFETANHLFGGAVGVALYATVLTTVSSDASSSDGYRAGFVAAALLAALGLGAAFQARTRTAR
jgi:EmrB/QacA subfamily drug resistance transporter